MSISDISQTTRLAADHPALQPWPRNRWYWSYHNQPVLLLGGSDDHNLFQWPAQPLIAQLERLAGAGGNVIRNTMSDRKDKPFKVYAFLQRPDGRHDLNQWNPEYWERFACMLRETHRRGIFVQIELWDRFDFTDNNGANHWQTHPYNPCNNVNYSYDESGFAAAYPDHPCANKQPFFFTTPAQHNNQTVLHYQQRFVDKVLDHSLAYDHVLYCMDNETSGEEAWSRYWATYVTQRAAREHRHVQVTEMWDDWELTAERHARTFDHPELYHFVDVSQNNMQRGQQHWDNFQYVRARLASQPRPINTIKTYGADGNKYGHTNQDGIERFWRHVLAGAACARFHRPPAGLGLNDTAVACIRAARKLESLMPLWTLAPANELVIDRAPNQAYAASDGQRALALYLPCGGTLRLALARMAGALTVRWIDISTGEWGNTQRVPAAACVPLTAPGNGNWAAALTI